ncbi:BTB/POZ domain-containing protein 6 isoform X2 [Anabrus simplex]
MFYGALRNLEVVIHVPDINPTVFRKILVYIYTDTTTFDTLDEAFQILYASKKYMLLPLSIKCRKYIAQNLDVTNVCKMFELVTSVSDEEDLHDQCLQFICMKMSEIMKDQSFMNLSPATLDVILDQDSLQIDSEVDIVHSVLRWACEECSRCELPVTSQNKRHVLQSALKRIRFFSLTPEEYADVGDICDILTPEEDSVILSNIMRRKVISMCPNLCSNPKKRLIGTAPKSCPQCRRTHKPVANNRSGSQISFGARRGSFGQSAYSNASLFSGSHTGTSMSCPYCGYVYTKNKFRDL